MLNWSKPFFQGSYINVVRNVDRGHPLCAQHRNFNLLSVNT